MGVAGLVENKANSARPAKLKLATSWGWAELGKNILDLKMSCVKLSSGLVKL